MKQQQFFNKPFGLRAYGSDIEKGLVVVARVTTTYIIFEVKNIDFDSCMAEPGSILELPGFLACERFSIVSTNKIFWPTKEQYSLYLSQVKGI